MAMLVSSNAKKLEDKHKVEIHEYYEDGEVVEHLVPFIKLPLSVNLKLAGNDRTMQDYSDDEKEREARRGKKKQKSRFPIQEPIRTTNLMDVRREPALHKYAPFVSNHRTLEAKPQYPTPHHNQFDGNQAFDNGLLNQGDEIIIVVY
ncbi:hypothetical protein MXB_5606 [Myxobolus squamalis]|nr:hypothetical protein MXB_5606 [Myxobolus squamalis]